MKRVLKASWTALHVFLALIGFFTLTVLIATVLLVRQQVHTFLRAAGLNKDAFIQEVKQGWGRPVLQENHRKNFLLLGLDELEGRNNTVSLTDTIMLVSLDVQTAQVNMISLPRDLWIASESTKINALYYYGKERYPNRPEQFTEEVVESLFGIPIHHVIVIKLSTVAKVIDALGGIDVQIDKGFTDPHFPRPGVDVATVKDPNILYQSVTFNQGEEHMNGERALIYVRSRHSPDPQEGTDDARARRQQDVIRAMVASAKNHLVNGDVETIGRLYALYNEEFSHSLPFSEMIALLFAMKDTLLNLHFSTFTIQPYLVHPPEWKYRQWVYEPSDRTGETIRQSVQRALFDTMSQ